MDEEQRDLDLAWDYLTRPGSTFDDLDPDELLALAIEVIAEDLPHNKTQVVDLEKYREQVSRREADDFE